MIFFGGYGRKAKQRGEVFFVCFECGRLNVFGLIENYGYAQVYGVRVAKYKSERFMACSHCQRGWELEPEQWRHALKVSQVLQAQANLTPRQLAQSALVLAEGALPALVATVQDALSDELEGGLDEMFRSLPDIPSRPPQVPPALAFLGGGTTRDAEESPRAGLGGRIGSPSLGVVRAPLGDAVPKMEPLIRPADAWAPVTGAVEDVDPAAKGPDTSTATPPNRDREDQVADLDTTSEDEVEEKRKALRFRLVEALESAGWDVQLAGGDIILGAGRIHVQALAHGRVLLYAPITQPKFGPGEVNVMNADLEIAAFISSYQTTGGEAVWGAFLRLSLPQSIDSAEELGRWLDPQVSDVFLATEVFDAAAEA